MRFFSRLRYCNVTVFFSIVLALTVGFQTHLNAQIVKENQAEDLSTQRDDVIRELDRVQRIAETWITDENGAASLPDPKRYDAELIRLLERVIDLDKSIDDKAHELESVLRLASIRKENSQFASQVELLKRAVSIAPDVNQNKPYSVVNLKIELVEAGKNQRLDALQLKLLDDVNKNYNFLLTALRQRDYKKSLGLAQSVSDQYHQLFGEKDSRYATSLNDLAVVHRLLGDTKSSIAELKKCCDIRRGLYGDAHPVYAEACSRLARVFAISGNSASTKKYVDIAALAYLESHQHEPKLLVNKISLLNDPCRLLGDFDTGISILIQARDAIGKQFGENHCDSIRCDAFIGFNLLQGGKSREAIAVCSHAIERLGNKKCSPTLLGDLLNNRAQACLNVGNSEQALRDFRRSMAERKRTFGNEHIVISESLNNFGTAYYYIGDWARAEELFQESIAILRKSDRIVEKAQAMINLANVKMMLGSFAEAEKLLTDAGPLLTRLNGASKLNLVPVVSGLAAVAAAKKDFGKAIRLSTEAKDICDEELGPNNPESFVHSMNISTNLLEKGQLEEAADQLLRLQKVVNAGAASQFRLDIQTQLGVVRQKQSKGNVAVKIFQEVLTANRKEIEATSVVLSERQQLAINQKYRHRLDNFVNACLRSQSNFDDAINEMLAWKGSTLLRQHRAKVFLNRPAGAKLASQLSSVVSELSQHSNLIPDEDGRSSWLKRTRELTIKKETLESEILSSFNSGPISIPKRPLALIRQALPADATLVDYLIVPKADQDPSLVASIIRRNHDPILIQLGSSASVEQAVDDWREGYGEGESATKAGEALRSQIWEPVVQHLGDSKLIFISPDGAIGKFPFAALPGKAEGSYLLDEFRIALTPAPLVLLNASSKDEPATSGGLLIVGNVNFDAKNDVHEQSNARKFSESKWTSLPATRRESRLVGELFKNYRKQKFLLLEESAATENRFLESAPKYEYLHVATHGYFASAEKRNALTSRGRLSSNDLQTMSGWNPGQLSGLVFAGANHAEFAQVMPSYKTVEKRLFLDGIVNADELALVSLHNTELVVLSACETGLGQIAGGEGLLGLQRSLHVAGAKSVIASLWRVNDHATMVLMTRFYQNLWERKMTKLDALREAQLWMLNNPQTVFDKDAIAKMQDRNGPYGPKLTRNRPSVGKQAKRLPPKYWAAFSISGDWK